jgi:hypothetical protein
MQSQTSACRRFSCAVLIAGLVVVGIAVDSTSAADALSERDKEDLLQMVDELKAEASKLPNDSFIRKRSLYSAAGYEYLLGRRGACEAFLQKEELAAVGIGDAEDRLEALVFVAEMWSAIDRAKARRMLADIDSLIQTFPPRTNLPLNYYTSIFFELGEYRRDRKALEAFTAQDPRSEIFMYSLIGSYCVRKKLTDDLTVLQSIVHDIKPDPEYVNEKWKIDVILEMDRVEVLALAGLPDEAAALYERLWKTGESSYEFPGGIEEIVRGYVQSGRRESAREFLRKHVSHVRLDRHELAAAAAYGGDHELAKELLGEAPSDEYLETLRRLVVVAHRMNDADERDDWLEKYRTALAGRPDVADRTPLHANLPCDMETVEVAIGRYERVLTKLSQLKGEQACAVRDLMIDLKLRERGRQFGRMTRSALGIYLDVDD